MEMSIWWWLLLFSPIIFGVLVFVAAFIATSFPSGPIQRRAAVVMSWSTTQRAVYNRLGRVATMTEDEQEAMRLRLVRQLELAEMGSENGDHAADHSLSGTRIDQPRERSAM